MLLSEFEIVFTFLLYFIVLCNFMEQEANKNHLNLQPAMSHFLVTTWNKRGTSTTHPVTMEQEYISPVLKKNCNSFTTPNHKKLGHFVKCNKIKNLLFVHSF